MHQMCVEYSALAYKDEEEVSMSTPSCSSPRGPRVYLTPPTAHQASCLSVSVGNPGFLLITWRHRCEFILSFKSINPAECDAVLQEDKWLII